MISENERIDGSWELTIVIPDIDEDVKVRVKGDLHVGGVLHKAVDKLQQKQDWSDHMLWWPERNMWLSHTRTTLDQYGVQSNSLLELIKVHNNISIMLPSLQQISVPVNYSADIFSVVVRICRELSIRFPEELSLQLPLKKENLKTNQTLSLIKSRRSITNNDNKKQNNKELPTPEPFSPNYGTMKYNTLGYGTLGTITPISGTLNKSLSSQMQVHSCNSLSYDGVDIFKYSECMKISTKSVIDNQLIVQPKNLIQKARLNCTWLDSSRSLMEQGMRPDSNEKTINNTEAPLHIRFKFNLFYDLNSKYDTIRIHQLYEQARWDLLSNRIECTEDEMVMFAALQLQAELRTEKADNIDSVDHVDDSNTHNGMSGNGDVGNNWAPPQDEIEIMLSELEEMYLGSDQTDGLNNKESGLAPEQKLEGSLRVSRVNKLGMKSQKRLWCVLSPDGHLRMTPSKDISNNSGSAIIDIPLPQTQIKPDVSVASNKYFIRLNVTNGSSNEEIRIQLDNKEEYAHWMAGLRLVRGRRRLKNNALMQKEVEKILEVLRLQMPGPESELKKDELHQRLGDCSDYISARIVKKSRSSTLRSKIGEMHAHVRALTLAETKRKYVDAWLSLEGCGISYVLVKMDGSSSNKEEMIGIGSNRLMQVNPSNGDILSTHYYSEMRSWNINWDAEKVTLDFKSSRMTFKPLSTNCKTVTELVGGYVFLNQRNPDKNQELNARLFHKLTGAMS